MDNFDYCNITRLIFGKGEELNVGKYLQEYNAKKVLVHYGTASIKKSGLYDKVISAINMAGIDYVELGGVKPNPRLDLVRVGCELCKREKVDFILAVGGGSVIDSSKAIAAGACDDGDVWDFFRVKKHVNAALPIATILTLPAAGSESSESTVITNEEEQRKLSFGTLLIRPLFSIINPELFFTLPKHQIANGISDMLCHVMERYFSNTTHVELTDGLCESVMRTILRNGVELINKPTDYDLWAEIAFSGTVAHNGLIGMGREEDWASHDIEHELSAIYDIAHGAGLAIIAPAWIKYVYTTNVPMFTQWAINVMGVRADLKDSERMIEDAVSKLEDFYAKLGLPTRLSQIGIDESNVELMATRGTTYDYKDSKTLGYFKKLTANDVVNIYKLAL